MTRNRARRQLSRHVRACPDCGADDSFLPQRACGEGASLHAELLFAERRPGRSRAGLAGLGRWCADLVTTGSGRVRGWFRRDRSDRASSTV